MSSSLTGKFYSENEEMREALRSFRMQLEKSKMIEEEKLKIIRDVNSFFASLISWHFRKEEEAFLPALQRIRPEDHTITAVLVEHKEFSKMYEDLQDLLRKDSSAHINEISQRIEEMMRFLEDHALKEDAHLLPKLDKYLSEDLMDEIIRRIKSIEEEEQKQASY